MKPSSSKYKKLHEVYLKQILGKEYSWNITVGNWDLLYLVINMIIQNICF